MKGAGESRGTLELVIRLTPRRAWLRGRGSWAQSVI